LLDTFYPQRPGELEDCRLYIFKKWYKPNGYDANGKRMHHKLNKPVLPNHRIYDPHKTEQREDYYYSLLLLFKPFRNESDLVKNGQTAEDAFNNFMDTCGEMKDHHENLMKMLNVQSKVRNINEHRAQNEETVIKQKENIQEGPEIVGEAASAMNDICAIDAVSDIDLIERLSKLNKDQRRIFEKLNDHFQHQYRHEHGECDCKDFKPVYMFVSGVGGTGKSFLIETIRAKVTEIWKASGNDGEIVQ